MNSDSCRFCGGPTAEMFRTAVLHKYAVSFLKCLHCESAQTEQPYWLTEAYADDRPLTDTGMVTRTIDVATKADLIFSLLAIPEKAACVDFGGSNGLFTRMMRDRGYNFYRSDPYTSNFYAPFHDAVESGIHEAPVVTAFEVFEHFSDPQKEIDSVFRYGPDVLLMGTEAYTAQAPEWWYFAPDQGQHVFFYSTKALNAIARHYGMYLFSAGSGLHLFCRKEPKTCGYTEEQLRRVQQLMIDERRFVQSAVQRSVSQWNNYKYATEDRAEILKEAAPAKLAMQRKAREIRAKQLQASPA